MRICVIVWLVTVWSRVLNLKVWAWPLLIKYWTEQISFQLDALIFEIHLEQRPIIFLTSLNIIYKVPLSSSTKSPGRGENIINHTQIVWFCFMNWTKLRWAIIFIFLLAPPSSLNIKLNKKFSIWFLYLKYIYRTETNYMLDV